MGFANIKRYVDSMDAGRYHQTIFRKQVSSAATVANDWIDYTYFSGNPPANFYASTPLLSAEIEANRGLQIPNVDNQFIKSLTVMSASANTTSTTNARQSLQLLDYLMYYPFIDTDAVGEEQVMENVLSLPRYESGDGVQIMAVGQSASSAVGTFTVNYTNSDGIAGRVSAATFTKVIAGGGVLVSSTTNSVAGSQPFIQLQTGDKGVRSIQSVTFTAAGGGLMALVLVKNIWHTYTAEECRTNNEGFGSAVNLEAVQKVPTKKLEQGAVLGIIGLGNAGSLASSVLVGTLETVWS